jgi:hypothetical protein
MNFFEAVEKVAEITGIVPRVRRAKEDAKKIRRRNIVHEKTVQFCSDQYKETNSLQALIKQNK